MNPRPNQSGSVPPQGQARRTNPLQLKIGNVGPSTASKPQVSRPQESAPTIQPFSNPPPTNGNSRPSQPGSLSDFNSLPAGTSSLLSERSQRLGQSGPANPLQRFINQSDAGPSLASSKGPRSVPELAPGSAKPFSYLYAPSPPGPINLGNNIWENYQTVSQEIYKKSQKLAEVNGILRQMRVSSDPNHINHMHNQIRGARQELQRISQDNQRAEAALQTLNDRAKALKDAEAAKESELQRFQLLAKSPQELNAQLAQLKAEHDKIRATVAKMDYDAKIQLDRESREEMDKKMYQIVVEAAQKNSDPRVQAALARVLANQKNTGLGN